MEELEQPPGSGSPSDPGRPLQAAGCALRPFPDRASCVEQPRISQEQPAGRPRSAVALAGAPDATSGCTEARTRALRVGRLVRLNSRQLVAPAVAVAMPVARCGEAGTAGRRAVRTGAVARPVARAVAPTAEGPGTAARTRACARRVLRHRAVLLVLARRRALKQPEETGRNRRGNRRPVPSAVAIGRQPPAGPRERLLCVEGTQAGRAAACARARLRQAD